MADLTKEEKEAKILELENENLKIQLDLDRSGMSEESQPASTFNSTDLMADAFVSTLPGGPLIQQVARGADALGLPVPEAGDIASSPLAKQLVAGGTETTGAMGGAMYGARLGSVAGPWGTFGGAVLGGALGDELTRQTVNEPLGLREETDIIGADATRRFARNVLMNTLFGGALKAVGTIAGSKAKKIELEAKTPGVVQEKLGLPLTQKGAIAGRELADHEQTLFDSGILQGGKVFDPNSGKFLVDQTLPVPQNRHELQAAVKNGIAQVGEAVSNYKTKIATTISEHNFINPDKPVGKISVSNVIADLKKLRDVASTRKLDPELKPVAEEIENRIRNVYTNLISTNDIPTLEGAISNVDSHLARLKEYDLRNLPESVAKSVQEALPTFRSISAALRRERSRAITQLFKDAPNSIHLAGLSDEGANKTYETFHTLSLLDAGLDESITALSKVGSRLEQSPDPGFFGKTEGVSISPTGAPRIFGKIKDFFVSEPIVEFRKRQGEIIDEILRVQKIRAGADSSEFVSAQRRALTQLGDPQFVGVPQNILESPFMQPQSAEAMVPQKLSVKADKIFESDSNLMNYLSDLTRSVATKKINTIGSSSGFDMIFESPEAENIFKQELSMHLDQEMSQVADALISAQRSKNKIDKANALSSVATTYSEFFPEPRSGVAGEIEMDGRKLLPRIEDRAIYSTIVMDNPNLSDKQKAQMRSAVHKDGTIIGVPE